MSRSRLFSKVANEFKFVHCRGPNKKTKCRRHEMFIDDECSSISKQHGTCVGYKHFAATRLSFANSGRLYRLRRIDSKPASIVSIEVEKEKRTCPSPCGPKTTPGTVATWARLRSNSVAARLSALIKDVSGKA